MLALHDLASQSQTSDMGGLPSFSFPVNIGLYIENGAGAKLHQSRLQVNLVIIRGFFR